MKLNPDWRNVSGVLILATLVIWGAYDLIPAFSGQDGSTISEVIQDAAAPPVLLAAGYLLGHFWPTKQIVRAVWRDPGEDE